MTLSENKVAHENLSLGHEPKVLFLIDRLHCTEGGAEGVVQKLCSSLPAHGFRCMVATFWAGEGVTQRFPCPVHIIPLTSMYGKKALRCARDFAFAKTRFFVSIRQSSFRSSSGRI
jgi:hypothetical protein